MSQLDLYHESAELYDVFELNTESGSVKTNTMLIEYLQRYGVKTVHDISCGTGAQIIELARQGFEVTASDLSEDMIRVAKSKTHDLNVEFHVADMRDVSVGKFDAIFSLFNSVGHLSPEGLKQMIANAFNNLNPGGLLIFDILNRSLMSIFPDYKFIDRALEKDNKHFVRFSHFSFDPATHTLIISQNAMIQDGVNEMITIDRKFELLTYKKKELVEMIGEAGFELVDIGEHGLSDFYKSDSPIVDCLMHFVVARKPTCNA